MKYLMLFLSWALMGTALLAQDITVSSKVNEVVIYRSQARETRTASVSVPKGTSQVILTGISTGAIDGSVQVALKGDATLLSMTTRQNYFAFVDFGGNQAKAQVFQDSIRRIDRDIVWNNEESSIASDEMALLTNLLQPNMPVKDGWSPQNINELADIHRKRFTELRRKIFDCGIKAETLNERRDYFQNKLNELAPVQKPPVKEIVLVVSADQAVDLQMKLHYLVSGASWRPLYDIHVANVNANVELEYRAVITQSTGIDWKDVKLTLSTSNPVANNNRPILYPVYVDYVQYRPQASTFQSTISNSAYYTMTPTDNGMGNTVLTSSNVPPATIENDYDLAVDFEVTNAQTIASDGREYTVKLKNHSIPATYKYHAVPKLDQAAFLLARITEYNKYNLLPGQANVFFGENYIGQVALNASITADTLLVSLGRDERIIVRRTKMNNKCSKKTLTDKQKEVLSYEITIRNNKSTPIEIEILDQIPKSRRKEFEVELLNSDKARYTEAIGNLKWEFKIDPGKSKKVEFEYSITMPLNAQWQEVN